MFADSAHLLKINALDYACCCLKTRRQQPGNAKFLVETSIKRRINTRNTLLLRECVPAILTEICTSDIMSAHDENILQNETEKFGLVRQAGPPLC